MAQTWVDLAKDQAAVDNVVIAEVDCTAEQSVCQENGVKGYPTLKAFKGGKEIEKYAGGRDMASFKGEFKFIVDFLKEMSLSRPHQVHRYQGCPQG